MTLMEKTKLVNSAIDEYANTTCYGTPDKVELKSLISLLSNTLLCVTQAPGPAPKNLSALRCVLESAYSLYSERGGKIVQRGLDIILE